jgi:hypothetical protein
MIEVQGGKASGPRVIPTGITPFENLVPRGKGFRTSQRGALHPVESSIQDMPSLPWNSSPIFLLFSPSTPRGIRHSAGVRHASFAGAENICREGLTAEASFRMVALPTSLGTATRTPNSRLRKCLTARSECPRLISPSRDEAL